LDVGSASCKRAQESATKQKPDSCGHFHELMKTPRPVRFKQYSGDFNGDGRPDFFAIKPTTACGIAGQQALAVFAFSEGFGLSGTSKTQEN
jgi:hypothetical protein